MGGNGGVRGGWLGASELVNEATNSERKTETSVLT